MIRLVLPYPPVTGNKPRRMRDALVWHKKLKAYREDVWKLCLLDRAKTFGLGPVKMTWRVWAPDNRERDWDNLEKIVNDSIKGHLIAKDCMTVIRKKDQEYCGVCAGGRVVIEIEAM